MRADELMQRLADYPASATIEYEETHPVFLVVRDRDGKEIGAIKIPGKEER